jgi:hypothetical protein
VCVRVRCAECWIEHPVLTLFEQRCGHRARTGRRRRQRGIRQQLRGARIPRLCSARGRAGQPPGYLQVRHSHIRRGRWLMRPQLRPRLWVTDNYRGSLRCSAAVQGAPCDKRPQRRLFLLHTGAATFLTFTLPHHLLYLWPCVALSVLCIVRCFA